MIFLVRFSCIEPIWLVVRAPDRKDCIRIVDEYKMERGIPYKYEIKKCKQSRSGVLIEEEY